MNTWEDDASSCLTHLSRRTPVGPQRCVHEVQSSLRGMEGWNDVGMEGELCVEDDVLPSRYTAFWIPPHRDLLLLLLTVKRAKYKTLKDGAMK